MSDLQTKGDLEATITAGAPSATESNDVAPRTSSPGRLIGRFEVRRELGSGGMGVVYVAYDPQLNRQVAIKVLHQDIGGAEGTVARERLLREAQAMAQVTHPNVVTVYDVGTLDGRVFIAMEYVRGLNFREWLASKRPTHAQIVAAYADAARGLAAAHSAGLVHRDFKPDNVLMADDGVVRVVDFGLATALSSEDVGHLRTMKIDKEALDQTRLTHTGAILGTPAYMAPEQLQASPADPRTDQFAWCVALFEALYGHRPFLGETLPQLVHNLMTHQLTEPTARARAKIPRRLHIAILRGLSLRSEDRFASMADLLETIASDSAPIRRGAWFLAVVVVCLGIAGAALLWSTDNENHADSTEDDSAPPVILAPGPGRTRPASGARLWIDPAALRFAEGEGKPTAHVLDLADGRIPADAIDNHLVLPLHEVLRDEDGDHTSNIPDPVVLFIDHRVPWTTVEDVLYSTLHADYLKWEFAVETGDGPRVFSAAPPMYMQHSKQMRRHAALQLWIKHESVEVGTQIMRPMEPGIIRALDVGDGGCELSRKAPAGPRLITIQEISTRLCDLSGIATPVWISAETDVSWGDVVATLSEVLSEHEGLCDGGVVITSDGRFDDCAAPTRLAEVVGLLEDEGSAADANPDPRRQAVAQSIRDRMPQLQACYERELAKDPSLESELAIELGISSHGSVTSVKVSSRGSEHAALTSCVGRELFTWTFEPAPEPSEVSMAVTMTGLD